MSDNLHCPECRVDDPYQQTWKHVTGTVEHPNEIPKPWVYATEKTTSGEPEVRLPELSAVAQQNIKFGMSGKAYIERSNALREALRNIAEKEARIAELEAKVQLLEFEAAETARIIGMSGSREAALLARLATCKSVVAEYRQQHREDGTAYCSDRCKCWLCIKAGATEDR